MNNEVNEIFGEEIRKQGRPEEAGRSTQNLVYNPITGEFELLPVGEQPTSGGQIATEMTRHGFA